MRLYLDGEEKHVATLANIGSSSAFFVLLGRVFDGIGNRLAGVIDEARVATASRSAARVATQYASQSDPESFYAVGPAQLAP